MYRLDCQFVHFLSLIGHWLRGKCEFHVPRREAAFTVIYAFEKILLKFSIFFPDHNSFLRTMKFIPGIVHGAFQ